MVELAGRLVQTVDTAAPVDGPQPASSVAARLQYLIITETLRVVGVVFVALEVAALGIKVIEATVRRNPEGSIALEEKPFDEVIAQRVAAVRVPVMCERLRLQVQTVEA